MHLCKISATMWNDTDEPIAYFITFRTYGMWLHCDKRGSIDRHNNRFGAPKIPENKTWRGYNTRQLTGEPVQLTAKQRRAVRLAIRDTCKKRGWILYAINVRTNPRACRRRQSRTKEQYFSQRIQSKRDSQHARGRSLAVRSQSLGRQGQQAQAME